MVPRVLSETAAILCMVTFVARTANAFVTPSILSQRSNILPERPNLLLHGHSHEAPCDDGILSDRRRHFLQSTAFITLASLTGASSLPSSTAFASDVATEVQEGMPMKRFVDTANPPLFVIDVPQRFFAIRRSAKGDLPDAKTGKGRRGGTIFTAGDMAKAEVIAIER